MVRKQSHKVACRVGSIVSTTASRSTLLRVTICPQHKKALLMLLCDAISNNDVYCLEMNRPKCHSEIFGLMYQSAKQVRDTAGIMPCFFWFQAYSSKNGGAWVTFLRLIYYSFQLYLVDDGYYFHYLSVRIKYESLSARVISLDGQRNINH